MTNLVFCTENNQEETFLVLTSAEIKKQESKKYTFREARLFENEVSLKDALGANPDLYFHTNHKHEETEVDIEELGTEEDEENDVTRVIVDGSFEFQFQWDCPLSPFSKGYQIRFKVDTKDPEQIKYTIKHIKIFGKYKDEMHALRGFGLSRGYKLDQLLSERIRLTGKDKEGRRNARIENITMVNGGSVGINWHQPLLLRKGEFSGTTYYYLSFIRKTQNEPGRAIIGVEKDANADKVIFDPKVFGAACNFYLSKENKDFFLECSQSVNFGPEQPFVSGIHGKWTLGLRWNKPEEQKFDLDHLNTLDTLFNQRVLSPWSIWRQLVAWPYDKSINSIRGGSSESLVPYGFREWNLLADSDRHEFDWWFRFNVTIPSRETDGDISFAGLVGPVRSKDENVGEQPGQVSMDCSVQFANFKTHEGYPLRDRITLKFLDRDLHTHSEKVLLPKENKNTVRRGTYLFRFEVQPGNRKSVRRIREIDISYSSESKLIDADSSMDGRLDSEMKIDDNIGQVPGGTLTLDFLRQRKVLKIDMIGARLSRYGRPEFPVIATFSNKDNSIQVPENWNPPVQWTEINIVPLSFKLSKLSVTDRIHWTNKFEGTTTSKFDWIVPEIIVYEKADSLVRFGSVDLYLQADETIDHISFKAPDTDDKSDDSSISEFNPSIRVAPSLSDDSRNLRLLDLDIRLPLHIGKIGVGEQDYEPDFETVSELIRRERPLSIPLDNSVFLEEELELQVTEKSSGFTSRSIEFNLVRPDQTEPGATAETSDNELDVIVLDPSPFAATRVRMKANFEDSRVLASYLDVPGSIGKWEFTGSDNKMVLLLPPQGIGEEMVRGKDGEFILNPKRAFDYRFTPATRLILRTSDLEKARTNAPWNLRQILGSIIDGGTGAEIIAMDLELFYGLAAYYGLDDGLRLAEIGVRIGRYPFPQQLIDLHKAGKEYSADMTDLTWSQLKDAVRGSYTVAYAHWIRHLQNRPAHWQPFYRFRDRQPLTLTEGLKSRIRRGDTDDPINPERYASNDLSNRKKLKGGAIWGFESQNILDEVESRPNAVNSLLQNLSFGALGGTGYHEATFANGKSIIKANVELGRTTFVTYVRIGRIVGLWNHAKHVIVYERTVRQPERYQGPETVNGKAGKYREGLAAMRKVAEYVEITQDTRTYPDYSDGEGLEGALLESKFDTKIVYVRSEWGRDVENGWIMPLSGPIPPGQEALYPSPVTALKLAQAEERGGDGNFQTIDNPENLVFFTSTRPEDGEDTDAWPAFPKIDFPLAYAITPPAVSGFNPDAPDALLGDDEEVVPGYEKFTFRVKSSGKAANVVRGTLPDTAIEAEIRNVTVSRGPQIQPPGGSNSIQANALEPVRKLRIKLADIKSLTTDRSSTVEHIKQEWDRIKYEIDRVKKAGSKVKQTIEQARIDSTKNLTNLQNSLLLRADDYKEKFIKLITSEISDAVSRVFSEADIGDKEKCKRKLETLLFPYIQDINNAITRVDTVPERILAALARARREFDALCDYLDRMKSRLKTARSELEAQYSQAQEQLKRKWRVIVETEKLRLQQLVDRLDKRLQSSLDKFLDTFSDEYLIALNTFLQLIDEKLTEVANATTNISQQIENQLETIKTEGLEELGVGFDKVIGEAKDKSKEFIEILHSVKEEAFLKLSEVIEVVCNTSGSINKLINNTKKILKEKYNKSMQIVQKKIQDTVGVVTREVSKFIKRIEDVFNFDNPPNLSGNFDDMLKTVQDYENKIRSSLNAVAGWINKGIEAEIILDENININLPLQAGKGMRLIRMLAEAPKAAGMEINRRLVGLIPKPAQKLLDMIPSTSLVNRVGSDVLAAVGSRVQFNKIAERLVPFDMKSIDFSQFLPDFGGLKLNDLLKDVLVPDIGDNYEWLKVKHGVDRRAMKAWADFNVDTQLAGSSELFTLGPVSMVLNEAHFKGHIHLEGDARGNTSSDMDANLRADWGVLLGGAKLVTLKKTALRFNNSGRFSFSIDPKNIEMAPAMDFLNKLVETLGSQDESGLSMHILPNGISTRLDLPLPDIGGGAWSITGLNLNSNFDLILSDGFMIRFGFWLGKPTNPFNIAVFILGGGGWFGSEIEYSPGKSITTRVNIGVAATASLTANLGVASGRALVAFTASFVFFSNSSSGDSSERLSIIVGILVDGRLSILGIVSISLSLGLTAEYTPNTGALIGRGWVRVKIKICWCFTLKVSKSVTYTITKGDGGTRRRFAAPVAALPSRSIAAESEEDVNPEVVARFDSLTW